MLRILLMAAVLARAGEAAVAGEAPPIDDFEQARGTTASRFDDPNRSRLLLAPTAWPMPKGQGYFSNHELLFPGFGYAFTDNVSVAGGVSTIPGLGLGEQLAYVSPKVAFQLSDGAAVSLGGLVAGVPGSDDDLGTLGVGYAIGTFGTRDRSLSLGVGVMRELGDRWAQTEPIVMVGGQVRVADSVALVSENWMVLDGDVRWDEQPFGLAVRLFNERLSADVGVILIGEVLEGGYPIPWASVTYHFGGPKRRYAASR
jgi:hypothetical protein